MISKHLEKRYETNNFISLVFSICFVTLPMLSTFVYGDLISIAFCLFGVLFCMKYKQKENIIYIILSSLFIAVAYIARMNNIVYIIAIGIYLILDLLERKNKTFFKILKKFLVIILFLLVSILPENILKSYWQKKLSIDVSGAYPYKTYFLIGMNESSRANGWYSDEYMSWFRAEGASVDEKYNEAIKNRLTYFLQKPFECIKFYNFKIASMWAENTYEALVYNHSHAFGTDTRKFRRK